MQEDFRANGFNGQLVLTGNKVIIERKGFKAAILGHGLRGSKEILIKSLSAIQIKNAGILHGNIQFTFFGGQEHKGGFLGAKIDENTVEFTVKQQRDFEQIKKMIEDRMEIGSSKIVNTNLDELKKLSDLKKEGVITEEEFNAKKKELLRL